MYIFATYHKYNVTTILIRKSNNKASNRKVCYMKKKILLVDDKSTIGKVAGVYLGKEYDFTYLEDPIKAIEWLNEGNVPDLIISDIRMPLMMGDEFLRYMKNNELFKSIPIVMLSSEESTTERIRLLEEGAEDYILKPFNPLELKIRIKKIID